MFNVGLTGSMGSGKTTVASMMQKCGAKVINVDRVAHRLLFRNSPCYPKIIKEFGAGILRQGRISRKKLGEIVFNEPNKLKKLEAIIHPELRKQVVKIINHLNHKKGLLVLDMPILFETGFDQLCDATIVVNVDHKKRILRLLKTKKWTEKEINQRLSTQMPIKEKIRRSNFIIDNNDSISQTNRRVEQLCQKLMMKQK